MGMISSTWAGWLDSSGLLESQGMFITGTDTGVGKTWVGVQLIHMLRALGYTVIPRKPVESGWQEDAVTQTDAWRLAKAAGLPLNARHQTSTLHTVCPYRFRAALAPPRAASMENKDLQITQAAAACPTSYPDYQFLLVEGAGGFYSPLAHDGLNADLAQILGLPVVMVSEDRLGCINQVLLTAEAIRQKGLQLAGIILNPLQPAPENMDNASDLGIFINVPVIRLVSA